MAQEGRKEKGERVRAETAVARNLTRSAIYPETAYDGVKEMSMGKVGRIAKGAPQNRRQTGPCQKVITS